MNNDLNTILLPFLKREVVIKNIRLLKKHCLELPPTLSVSDKKGLAALAEFHDILAENVAVFGGSVRKETSVTLKKLGVNVKLKPEEIKNVLVSMRFLTGKKSDSLPTEAATGPIPSMEWLVNPGPGRVPAGILTRFRTFTRRSAW